MNTEFYKKTCRNNACETLIDITMRITRLIFIIVIGSLAIFSGVQIVSSFLELLQAGSNLIHLILVEPENNLEIQKHPYYTICPIFEKPLNVTGSNATLASAMMNSTVPYPESLFLPLFNSQALKANRFTTWVKMRDSSKRQMETLMQCTTFEIPRNVTPGKNEGKVWK